MFCQLIRGKSSFADPGISLARGVVCYGLRSNKTTKHVDR